MTTITRFGVLSVGKMLGGLYLLFGFLIGGLFALISLFGGLASLAGSDGPEGVLAGLFFGVGSIILWPLFYGVMGFIGGILSAWIYNLVARLFGGIEMELSGPVAGHATGYDPGTAVAHTPPPGGPPAATGY